MALAEPGTRPVRGTAANLAEHVYAKLKRDITEFAFVPGDRFTEAELAERMKVSRTPVREALFRLATEGFVEVASRSGWRVCPLDFDKFDQLYDVRVILELAAARKLCEMPSEPMLTSLKTVWLVPAQERLTEGRRVAALDEAFHAALVSATGNAEMARIHRELTDRIRIVRRLDFTQPARIESTYAEHARILRAVMQRKADQAQLLLRTHIETSKTEVRKITLHTLYAARSQRNG
jgi:DNA-binding GntR family transcriptional regulator